MIYVRPYETGDYDEVRRLYENSNTFGGYFDEDRDSAERMAEQSKQNANSILVAEMNGMIVGTVSILFDKRFAWLARFAVKEEYESEVSSALFQKASEILKIKGHKEVLVYAPAEEKKFVERYQALNFTKSQQNYTSYWRILQ